ncbi:outer membrane lipoprotein-sorting protein, partial [bacterium]|nr:outer membrane lipoprotein-sorting protein [bacterium]
MKSKLIMTLALVMLFFVGIEIAFCEMTGLQIVETTWRNFRLIDQEYEKITILQSESGEDTHKTLIRWSDYDSGGEDKITIKFEAPARDKGLSLLTHRHNDESDDQWLRMPSWKKVRRVSVSNESKYFAGTDLTYEDVRQLSSERTTDFRYDLIENNTNCWMIKAMPKPDIQSGYAYRIFQIDKKSVLIKIEYYGANGSLIKIQHNKSIQSYDNGAWRANVVEIDNVLLNRKTTIRVAERNITPENNQSIFTKMFLLRN